MTDTLFEQLGGTYTQQVNTPAGMVHIDRANGAR